MQSTQATGIKVEPPGCPATENRGRGTAPWRVVAYIAAVLPLLVIVLLARMYPDLNRQEIPDWRPAISLAEEFLKKRDLYRARHLYLQADRIAAWRQDWDGLVAAACGIYRLDGINGPYSKAFAILIRATTAADFRKSRRGIATVAQAFAAIGADKAAKAALARIQPDWPDETNDSYNVQLLAACRGQHAK